MKKSFLSIVFAGLLSSCGGVKQELMPVYVEPYYNSGPFKINVGEYSARLATDSQADLRSLAEEIKNRVDEVNIETLYVLAIRMYDSGMKDEAAYWYYTAQFRGNVFLAMEDAIQMSELGHALGAFRQLSGEWINGYAHGDPDKLVETLEQVVKDAENMGYVGNAYPERAFKSREEQAVHVQEQIDGVTGFMEYIRANKDEILRMRKENGIEGKY